MKSLSDVLIACSDLFSHPFTMADMEQLDEPALHVNVLFEKATGYSRAEVLGRNFRFLQGELSSRAAIATVRLALQKQRALHVDLVNYKKDGTPFWNRMVLLPLKDGNRRFYIGMQLDVTERKDDLIGRDVARLSLPQATSHQIHHEIRNPLAVIMNSYSLMTEADFPQASDRLTAMIFRAVTDLTSYVRNLPWTPTPKV